MRTEGELLDEIRLGEEAERLKNNESFQKVMMAVKDEFLREWERVSTSKIQEQINAKYGVETCKRIVSQLNTFISNKKLAEQDLEKLREEQSAGRGDQPGIGSREVRT